MTPHHVPSAVPYCSLGTCKPKVRRPGLAGNTAHADPGQDSLMLQGKREAAGGEGTGGVSRGCPGDEAAPLGHSAPLGKQRQRQGAQYSEL